MAENQVGAGGLTVTVAEVGIPSVNNAYNSFTLLLDGQPGAPSILEVREQYRSVALIFGSEVLSEEFPHVAACLSLGMTPDGKDLGTENEVIAYMEVNYPTNPDNTFNHLVWNWREQYLRSQHLQAALRQEDQQRERRATPAA